MYLLVVVLDLVIIEVKLTRVHLRVMAR